ncbi:hypothetical protein [Kyrpidia spormannii]|uniref:hypothetical protein n=1 Tax=Kyrpidia spormannii TaxID=2055160 RepID=UPI0018E479AF|nr:hypothetical protein [Kyrpidia spormannii]
MEKNAVQIEGELAKLFLEAVQNGHEGQVTTLHCVSLSPGRQFDHQPENEEASPKKGDF